MKFPYGIADFHKVITQDYFYADRTDHIVSWKKRETICCSRAHAGSEKPGAVDAGNPLRLRAKRDEFGATRSGA